MAVLTQPWPPDLHPSRVPFRKRTATMLHRAGLWDDMTQIDQLCTCDIAALDGIGPVTVNELVAAGNDAVQWHQHEAKELEAIGEREAWTRQVWHRDKWFADLLPPAEATAYEILVDGRHDHQRHLRRTLPGLRERVAGLADEPAEEALIRYVSANARQDRQRTIALLHQIGLLQPVISKKDAARDTITSASRDTNSVRCRESSHSEGSSRRFGLR